MVLTLLLLLVAYIACHGIRIWRALSTELPHIPLGIELHYGRRSAGPYTLVVLGDSTAQGIGADSPSDSFGAKVAAVLADDGDAVRFVNLGVDGAKARHVIQEQLPRLAGLHPDVVLLSVGANDVTAGTPISRYLQQVAAIVDRLEDMGARVLVLSIPAIDAVPLLPLPVRLVFVARANRFNDGLRLLVERKRNASFVPICEATRMPFRKDRTNFCADLHHPSSAGYSLWAEVILERLGGRD